MPRLRSRAGVVVNVDDATASRLGPEWEPAEEPAADEKKAAAPRRSTKK